MTSATEALVLLEAGLDQAATLVASTSPDQLDQPTNCADWDVQALLNHMVGGLGKFRDTMEGQKPAWGAEAAAEPPGDWGSAYRNAADQLLAAWQAEGAMDRSYPFMGRDAPAAMVANFQLVEVAVHTWDLACACGQVDGLDERVASAALSTVQGILKPEMRGTAFAPERQVPGDAGAYARLAAFTGRAVDGAQPGGNAAL